MIYFFANGSNFVQCELHIGEPHLLRLIQPGGIEHTEAYYSATELDDRWSEVRTDFAERGWIGPFGRDARA